MWLTLRSVACHAGVYDNWLMVGEIRRPRNTGGTLVAGLFERLLTCPDSGGRD